MPVVQSASGAHPSRVQAASKGPCSHSHVRLCTDLMALKQATTIPVDCSWHMPNSPRSAVAEYLSGPRIPQARRFDLDEVAELDPGKNPLSLSHMMPSLERFAEECSQSSSSSSEDASGLTRCRKVGDK